jgi:hypothetical protein
MMFVVMQSVSILSFIRHSDVVLSVIMLSVIMLSVIMLNVILHSDVIQSVSMLNHYAESIYA